MSLPYHVTDIITEDAFSLQADFGLYLWRQLPLNETLVFSPLAIVLGLTIIHNATRNQTEEEFQEPLRFVRFNFDPVDYSRSVGELLLSQKNPGAAAHLANGIFIRQGATVNDEFLNKTLGKFMGTARFLDFSSPEAMKNVNSFINSETNEEIDNFLTNYSNPDVSILLASALSLHANWKNPFYKTATVNGMFHKEDGTNVVMPIMHNTDEYLYGDTEQWQVLGIPYANPNFTLNIILSKNGSGITSLREPSQLEGTDLRDLVKNLKPQEVAVTMPKFKITQNLDVKPLVESLGIKQIFTKEADITGMGEDLFVSDIRHSSHFTVDEEGTSPASKNHHKISSEFIGDEPVIFRADKPFFFALTHRDSVLFMGQFCG